jgi:hypothetical protein
MNWFLQMFKEAKMFYFCRTCNKCAKVVDDWFPITPEEANIILEYPNICFLECEKCVEKEKGYKVYGLLSK